MCISARACAFVCACECMCVLLMHALLIYANITVGVTTLPMVFTACALEHILRGRYALVGSISV